ncbi:MAG: error-prone DNA polymerase [Alphaproteobacteria bacterium]|nr:error-prone DNA polymerase [Alphaproteobacteria bacterium]
MKSGYAELAITTNFSFLRGASHPSEIAAQASMLGLSAIGIADRNSLAGVVRAFDALRQIEGEKPRLLIGSRLVFADGTADILVYPEDRKAYGNLCRLLTQGKMRAAKGSATLYLSDLLAWQEGLLMIVLAAPGRISASAGDEISRLLTRLSGEAPGRVWLGASMLHHGEDRRRLGKLRRLADVARVPLIAHNDVLYHAPERRSLQDVVSCIREHVTLDSAGRLLEANAERHLKPPAEMARLFRDAPDAVGETLRFAARIGFSLDELKYNYPSEPVPEGKTAQQHLEELTWQGAAARYRYGIPKRVRATLEKELQLIETLGLPHYFLTVHDIVRIAGQKKILCQGRGSAANSAVCYALGITAVDPIQIDLLFERFVSQERKEPPDIDVDFEHERREEIIQDIYARYGRERAALTATVITYRPRSAIREVGKAFGLTEDVTAALAGAVRGGWGSSLKEGHVRLGRFDPQNATIARAVLFANLLIGFPRHLSQHPGGFVLTEDRLDTIVPIGPAAMEDRWFIEWDKDDIDALGMMKVDVLALGMLTCIRKAFALIGEFEGRPLDLARVPREDPEVYAMLCRADAIGVFQVESRAQMNMLPRLKPKTFYDLVIEVAIVRPGPIQGDMVHPYLRRRGGSEIIEYPAPDPAHGPADELKQVLGKTMGVPLFQEQAMKLAIVAARFTPDEANGLRRAMATFRNVGTIDSFREKMVGGMVARGYAPDFAERCFHQIEGFGSYGFPESHAASFAHLVYISAWIKCHYPAEFACALLNSQPMGFYAPAEIVRDAREHGVEVRPPDINFSEWDNTLEALPQGQSGRALRLGFRQIDSLGEIAATAILAARGEGYLSVEDFAGRTGLRRRALIILAEADAFGSIGLARREALWKVRRLSGEAALPLFEAARAQELAEEEIAPLPKMSESEEVLADYQTLRLSLKGHPMQYLRALFSAEKVSSCAHLQTAADGARARCAGVVLVRQMPGTAGVVFITLADETGIANVVVWPRVLERFRAAVMGSRLLLIEGKIQRSPEGIVHLVSDRIIDRSAELERLSEEDFRIPVQEGDIPPPPDPRGPLHRHPRNVRILPKSRDFH